jgi:hypothetical protein
MVEGNLWSDIRKTVETKNNTLEIGTIYFVNAVGKREKYFRET